MRNLVRNRRGSVAFATVIALVPAIGFVALGAEAGSWYVTKQHAQNAADAGAYSGALKLACSLSTTCEDTRSVDYRGKQLAAQNAFCNSGDTAYPGTRCTTPPSGISRTVQIASLNSWKGVVGNYVQATVTQQQPAYLAQLLGFSTVNIAATAVAAVQGLAKPPCALSLTGSISFQGSPNILAPNCGMATNSTATDALNFTGGGMTMNLGSLSGSGGCAGAATFCDAALTYMPPIPNPFAALDALTMPTLSNCTGGTLTAYSAATPCKNNNVTYTGNTDIVLGGGVYFISGKLELKGNGSITGTGLFILLPGTTFSMKGGGTINIVGNQSVSTSQVPTVLQPYTSLLAGMALYYQGTTAVTIGGGSQITFGGNMYLPNAAVTFQGNPTITLNGQQCGQLVAASLAFNGNATFQGNQCGASSLTSTRYVALVP